MAEFFERPPSRKARHSASSERRSRKPSKPNQEQKNDFEQEIQEAKGDFQDDFQKFCKKFNMTFIPVIENRFKRPPSPVGKNRKQSDEIKENEPPETSIKIIDNYEYFKPKIQVEKDSEQKIKEIYIRGWRVDLKTMQVFEQCFPVLDKLTTLNLWNCGLDEETVDKLTDILAKCTSIKNLVLDGNNIKSQIYHKLLTTEKTVLQLLSVRNCGIDDDGAENIGKALSESNNPDSKLITLNLSGNHITDQGAINIAKGLRSNRSLLVLNLSGNKIGDLGAKYIAESLSRFKLSHDEIVLRRFKIAEKLLKEKPVSPRKGNERPLSQHTNKSKGIRKDKSDDKLLGSHTSRDRSKSKEPTITNNNNVGGGRESSMDKSNKKKETVDLNKGKDVKRGTISTLEKNKTKKGSKGKIRDSEVESDTSSLKSFSGFSNINMASVLNEQQIESFNNEPERIDGELWMPGNRILISLNLSRNQISEKGMEAFLLSMQYQLTLTSVYRNQAPGLLRLDLTRNLRGTMECETHLKILEIMRKKDPILNRPKDDPNSINSQETSNLNVPKELPATNVKKTSK